MVEKTDVISRLRLDDAPTGLDLEAIRREIERLQASAARNKTLFDTVVTASPHGIIVCDAEGRLILQNPAAEKIWRGSATAASVSGWGQYRAYFPNGRPYAAEDWAMARCLSRRESIDRDEVIFQRFDDSMGVLLGSCAPLLGTDGELQGAVSVFADITPIKRAEAQLKLITDALPVLIFNIDASGRCLFANWTYRRWFGRDNAEIEGRHLEDVLGATGYQSVRGPLARALQGETVTFETTFDTAHDHSEGHPDGHATRRIIEATCIPHLPTNGRVDSVVVLLADATVRKSLERAREESFVRAERMLTLLEALAAAVDTSDVLRVTVEKGCSVTQAKAGAVWLRDDSGGAELAFSVGFPADPGVTSDARRNRVVTVLHSGEPDFRSEDGRALACVPLVVAGEAIGALTFSFLEPHKFEVDETTTLRIVAAHAAQALQRARLFDQERQAKSDTELLYDLTDLVNREPSLDASLTPLLASVCERLKIEAAAILLVDREGLLRFKAWQGLSEGSRELLEGRTPSPLANDGPVIVPDVRHDQQLSGLLSAEKITGLAFVPLIHGGRVLGKFLLGSRAPRTFSQREIRLTQAIADQVAAAVTEIEAQADRDRLIEELTRTVKLNELFTGILGHDLRNPLQSMLTAAELIIRKAPDPKFATTAGRIVTSGNRMNRMIEQLLDFTRIRAAGTAPIERTSTDVAAIWRQAIDELTSKSRSTTTGKTRVELLEHGDATGQWDPDRLAQVASNLIGNALRHGDPDGPVAIEVDGTDPDLVTVHVHNGGAIPETILPKIFEPFQSGQRGAQRGEGLGLGLFITRQIVTAHGGVVDVVSSPTEGTEFTIRLPRDRNGAHSGSSRSVDLPTSAAPPAVQPNRPA